MKSKREFIDKFASKGRPKIAPLGEVKIAATAASRSLGYLIKDKTIRVEIRKNGSLVFNFSNVIGDKAVITKRNALLLLRFIEKTYNIRREKE